MSQRQILKNRLEEKFNSKLYNFPIRNTILLEANKLGIDVASKSKNEEYNLFRQASTAVLVMGGDNARVIGEFFGGRTAATILYHFDKIEEALDGFNPELLKAIEQLHTKVVLTLKSELDITLEVNDLIVGKILIDLKKNVGGDSTFIIDFSTCIPKIVGSHSEVLLSDWLKDIAGIYIKNKIIYANKL